MALAHVRHGRWRVWSAAVAGALLVAGLTPGLPRVRAVPAEARPAAGNQGSQLSIAFGPGTIWQPSMEAIGRLQACTSLAAGCVRQVMAAYGAGEDAIAFYQLTGWFLTGLQDTGVVQLGTMLNPWRANENSQPVLLGGVPAVIEPEAEASQIGFYMDVTRNAQYLALQAAHPDLLFWTAGPRLEGIEPSPRGGPRFVYRYALLDGCHACAGLGDVRAAFDFSADGVYFGLLLLDIEPANAGAP